MAISQELMNELIKELESSSFTYSCIITDGEGNPDKNRKAFRTFDNTEDYVFNLDSLEFSIHLETKRSTSFSEYYAKEALRNIKMKNLAYKEKRMIHNIDYPVIHALPEELMKEVLAVFSHAQHLTQAPTSKFIAHTNMVSYLNMNLNVQYRLYLEKKSVSIILNSQDVVSLDEKEVKKLLNLIKINEYEYHKKLEEFNLKAKDELTHHDMQLKAVI